MNPVLASNWLKKRGRIVEPTKFAVTLTLAQPKDPLFAKQFSCQSRINTQAIDMAQCLPKPSIGSVIFSDSIM